MNCTAFILCLDDHLLFALNLRFSPCWNILQLIPLFVNSGHRIQYLHCLGHKENFEHEDKMTHRIEPSDGNVTFMIFVLSLWYALSC